MPRQNFNILLKGISHTYGNTPGNPGTPFDYGPVLVDSRKSTETTTGTSRKKPTGWIPPTAYTFRKESINYPRGHHHKHQPWPYDDLNTHIDGLQGGNVNVDGALRGSTHEAQMVSKAMAKQNEALIKARVKLKATDVNLGIAYAERNRTARLVGDTATRLFKSLRHLKSGRIRRAMDELGITSRRRQPRGSNVPQKWLELQYGWKPLLSDVYGASQALTGREKSDWRVTVKAAVTEDISDEWVTTLKSHPAYCSGKGFVGAFVRIDALPLNDAIISLSSLGISNPLLVGWELVPFSFVVDWFLPIGSYLESLDALLGYSSTASYCSQSYIVKYDSVCNGKSYSSGTTSYSNQWTGSRKLVKLVRTIPSGVPLPTFPRFKDPRSLGHMANGLALLSQIFGR